VSSHIHEEITLGENKVPTAIKAKNIRIRYEDHGSHTWIWREAPCSWNGRVEVEFITASFRQLEPSGSLTDPAVVEKWIRRMQTGRTVPPMIVCTTERGTLYIRDGNHRYEAMRRFFIDNPDAKVRVARVVPAAGYGFRYRWLSRYGTYILEPTDAFRGPHRNSCSATRV